MSIFSKIGGALKGGVGVLGDVAKTAAPFAGMIPGVGTLAATAMGGLGSAASDFGHGRAFNLGGDLMGAAKGAAGGLAGKAMGAMGGSGGPASGIMGKIGGALKSPGMFGNAQGGLDLGKMLGAGGAISSAIGQNKQRNQAQNYNNTMIDQRNKLLSSVLAGSPTGLPSATAQNTLNTGSN